MQLHKFNNNRLLTNLSNPNLIVFCPGDIVMFDYLRSHSPGMVFTNIGLIVGVDKDENTIVLTAR